MAGPLISPPRVLVAIALLLFINSQLPVRYGGKIGGMLRPVADLVALPIREPVFRLARRLNRPDNNPNSQGTIDPASASREQLALAHQQLLTQLGTQRQRINDLKRQLANTQGFAVEDLPPRNRVPAKVSAYTDAGTRHILSIHGGTHQGIAAGQTVLYGTRIVGRVVEPVGPVSADVELITSQDIGFQIELTPPADPNNPSAGNTLPGLERLRIKPLPAERLFTAEVSHDVAPPIGALARLADEIHYRDARAHILGRVEEVRPYPPDPQLLKQIVIRPTLDLRFLNEVVILVPKRVPPKE